MQWLLLLTALFGEWHRLQAVNDAWPEDDEVGSDVICDQLNAIGRKIYGAPIHDIHDLAVKARLHQAITRDDDDPEGRDALIAGIEHLASCQAA